MCRSYGRRGALQTARLWPLGQWRTFYVEDSLPDLREYALEVRLGVAPEIEHLRQTGSYAA
jgi:hypothetical protein